MYCICLCVCVALPGCNVNHPVQGWVWPEVNEAKNQTKREFK